MQKVWRQIGFSMANLAFLNDYMYENHLKNESKAVEELIRAHKRFQTIINNLEQAAWQQTDIDKKPIKKEE